MKDIDFDELDQAVSSVLSPTTEKAATPDVIAGETTVTAASPEAALVPEPSASELPVAQDVATPSPAPKPPLAIKRRGQFMDVVHPSSDMTGKPGEVTAKPAMKVTISPISESVKPEDMPELSTDMALPVTAAEPEAPVETIDAAPAQSIWPDPIDAMADQEKADQKTDSQVESVEDVPAEDPADTVAVTTDAEDELPATTPFLTDTKVDKRPLDAFSGEDVPAEAEVEPEMPIEPMSPELQPDVVAVESNPSDVAENSEEEPVPVEKETTPEPAFNASIAQQYVAAENQADEDHSIFDTKEYHQPLAPANTKKRGLPAWLVAILVIVLLAGVGAAGGYFWFYYGL